MEEEPLAELNAAEVEAHKLFVDSYVVPYIEEVVSKLNTASPAVSQPSRLR